MLSDAELLAVCLGSGRAGEDMVALARRTLHVYGGLEALLQAPVPRLLQLRGFGPAKVATLKAIAELAQRPIEAQASTGRVFSDVTVTAKYLIRRIGHSPREVFGCLFLDSRHRLIQWDVLFKGSINRAHVHAREVLRAALAHNAAAVILAHNHPSGVAEPSHSDLLLTRELKDLLARVDVAVLDHIVVSAGAYVSLAQRGLLEGRVTE